MQVGQPMAVSQVTMPGARLSPPPANASIPTASNLTQPAQPGQGQAVSYFTPSPQYQTQYYPFRSPYIVPPGGPNNLTGTNPHTYSHRRPNNRNGSGGSNGPNSQQATTIGSNNANGVAGQR